MAIKEKDILLYTGPTGQRAFLLNSHPRWQSCGENPIIASHVDDAIAKFQANIDAIDTDTTTQAIIKFPGPLAIINRINDKMEQIYTTLLDIHGLLKALNTFGATDDATEATVNAGADTRWTTLRNALIAYQNYWSDKFAEERADAAASPAVWIAALLKFLGDSPVLGGD